MNAVSRFGALLLVPFLLLGAACGAQPKTKPQAVVESSSPKPAAALAQGPEPETHPQIDVVFVVDSTGSMSSRIDEVKQHLVGFVNRIASASEIFRVGLVTYRDFPERSLYDTDYPSKVDLELTDDIPRILSAIEGIELGEEGHPTESVYSGISEATELDLSYASRTVIQIGDGPPIVKEADSDLNSERIVEKLRDWNPVVLYSIDTAAKSSKAMEVLGNVADKTLGARFHGPSPEKFASALDDIFAEATRRPSASAQESFVIKVGESINYEDNGSYSPYGSSLKYKWDLDGNGTFESTSKGPDIKRKYTRPFKGFVRLRVTDDRGREADASVFVQVTRDGDQTDDAEDNCPDKWNDDQVDYDGDGVGDACDKTNGFPTKDKEGVQEVIIPHQPSDEESNQNQ